MNEDINEQILTEFRRLRRSSNIAAWFCIILLVAALAYLALRFRTFDRPHLAAQPPAESWEAVRTAMDHFDYDRASAMAERIVQRYPNDYYGYAYLGNIALATGRVKDAEAHYARAVELLPLEEHEKMLTAIRTRLLNDAAKQQGEPK